MQRTGDFRNLGVPVLCQRNSILWLQAKKNFTLPFFTQEFSPQALQNGRLTDLNILRSFARNSRFKDPGLFIFHIGRCGSTLVSQALRRSPQTLVISESTAVNGFFRETTTVENKLRKELLRGLLKAYNPKSSSKSKVTIFKFTSWNIEELGLILAAFPQTPWVFVHRNPVEVLSSYLERPPAWAKSNFKIKSQAKMVEDFYSKIESHLNRNSYWIDHRDIKIESILHLLFLLEIKSTIRVQAQITKTLKIYSKDPKQKKIFLGDHIQADTHKILTQENRHLQKVMMIYHSFSKKFQNRKLS